MWFRYPLILTVPQHKEVSQGPPWNVPTTKIHKDRAIANSKYLTHFWAIFRFNTPWKHDKTFSGSFSFFHEFHLVHSWILFPTITLGSFIHSVTGPQIQRNYYHSQESYLLLVSCSVALNWKSWKPFDDLNNIFVVLQRCMSQLQA